MTVPVLKAALLSESAADTSLPVLIVGASLGTSARMLWKEAAAALSGSFRVIGWDLPGHGHSPRPEERFTVVDLAEGVASLVTAMREHGELGDQPVFYAGDSLGGAVGLQLGIDYPDLFAGLGIICSAAKIGTEEGWLERAKTVAGMGTTTMVIGSGQRWFAPDFMERQPEVGSRLLHSLSETDDQGYVFCCEALAQFDVRDRLGEISAPLIAIAGQYDGVTTYEDAWAIASAVQDGSAEWVADAAHLVPAERPDRCAEILIRHFERAAGVAGSAASTPAATEGADHAMSDRLPGDPYDAGMAVRRQVLGDAHVDRATASITDTTAEFQEMITRYAWGTIWTRPGLPRTTRSAMVLTALIAHSHWEEFAMHVRAALRNGMTRDEIKEVILQSAIYCSVPSANSAFKVAQQVFAEPDLPDTVAGR
ncbi:bifunctional 3-oxoadipate enol-lactonase/4-carboxymuconolactone decarboxylase PcaDC [Lysinibacter cavernae]|uniref:3-oxoadipate enol-lactonase/4-carboxymuconolactone decarboxylase n=2 Tax=Lysinibacter cavernae TaxID=1640652 RepID=A0A7X5R049_9MICO|nr:3-oxoadipate enol-lactonase/4-carboxymuconolactone decarboxylase [Lysinibacter cavernae]